MGIESKGGSYGGMHRGGGPGKDPIRSEWDQISHSEKTAVITAYYAPLQQARIEKWRAGLTQEELDAITPWGLLPIDRIIKLGLAISIKKLLGR